jgi:hypothetical protein
MQERNTDFSIFSAYGNYKESNMRELTDDEIGYVSGSWGIVGAVVGAIGGAAAYYGNSVVTGDGSWGGMAGATLAGAVGGFFLGPTGQLGANSILSGTFGVYGGMISGGVENMVNS